MHTTRPSRHHVLDIVVPVFNEEKNLPLLVEELRTIRAALAARCSMRVTFVDDGSSDGSGEFLRCVAQSEDWCRAVLLANNCGSHVAILAGLAIADGDCAAFLAADMQDPASMLGEMLTEWEKGHDAIWAGRRDKQASSSWLEARLSAAFWSTFTRISGFTFPPQGVDFALIDRSLVRALPQCMTANSNIVAEICMVAGSQTCLFYDKRKRLHGKSKWTVRRKLEACVDALVGYSYVPIRFMTYCGLGIVGAGLVYSASLLVRALFGAALPLGWPTLMASLYLLGGVVMVMLGIIGEYVWRILEVSRRRPLYMVKELIARQTASNTASPRPTQDNGNE